MTTSALADLAKPSIHWLFAFLPVTLLLEDVLHASAPLVFFSAALAIVPIAHLIVSSTEKIALHTGDAVGGLLNATFGNAPEMIISLVALSAGLHELVLGSIAGALLANLLLSIGLSFLIGGYGRSEQSYNPQSVRLYNSMMLVAVISMMVPSAFYRMFSGKVDHAVIVHLNLWLALVFLATYGLYLWFMLGTHKELFRAVGAEERHEGALPSLPAAVASLVGASALAAWMSEILVGAAEGTGQALGMSSAFIGMILLAVVGGAAESFSAIAMARKDRMDMSLGIAMGSCVQIALFVTPVLVLVGSVVGEKPFVLQFGSGAILAVLLTVLMTSLLASDGKSNWFKGVQLLVVYLILASMLYFIPELH